MIRKMGDILLFFAKTLLFCIVLSIYFIGQIIFYEHTLFYYWGNYIIIILYAAYLYFLCRIYQAFMIGSLNPTEIILSWILCLAVTNTLQYLILSLVQSSLLSIFGFLAVLTAQIIILIPLTLLIDKLYYHLNPVQKAIIIYGDGEKANIFQKIVERNHKKFEISNVISQDEAIETIKSIIESSDCVIFMEINEKSRSILMEHCFLHNKRSYIMPAFSDIMINTAEIAWISDIPLYLPKSSEPDMGTRFMKRCMDIFISLFAIVLLSPIMLITWLLIVLYDRQKGIYKQVRVTKGGKLFTLYKFRSMRTDAEDDGIPRLTTKDDDRITPIGRFIRKTRIDELPQLFNVLAGSMSLVGPRPERPEIAKQYEEIYPNFSLRTKVKAGLTGFAQIHGRYNTAPDEKLLMDIMYIERFTIWQDCRLILQTLKVLFKPSSTEGVDKDKETAL
ncbi:MAG: exopolysaccharide biosynthesis polyprenyl glycosylphosphotransferase [Oscillospiraceae bacterium]|nr:exopolysaccharide biosynthesis polyprenyl glycosylphosphotransferase [Oscillospiraceae bacterium]